jgi:putative NADH-flavin reductase
MNILIIGANGGIGKKTVETALAAGHLITAMVRNPASLSIVHPELKIVQGDIRQPETFEKYLDGQDAIISAIGEKNREPTTLYSEGNRKFTAGDGEKGFKKGFLYFGFRH